MIVVWENHGATLSLETGELRITYDVIGESLDIGGPSTPAEWDELLHRLATAAGRHIVAIQDPPKKEVAS